MLTKVLERASHNKLSRRIKRAVADMISLINMRANKSMMPIVQERKPDSIEIPGSQLRAKHI